MMTLRQFSAGIKKGGQIMLFNKFIFLISKKAGKEEKIN